MSFTTNHFGSLTRALCPAAGLMICLLIAGSTVIASPTQEQTEPERMAVKPLAHVEAADLANVLELLDIEWVTEPTMNAVVLRGKKASLEAALHAIDALDQPAPMLELTMLIVSASKDYKELRGIPADLEPVTAQLGGVFGFTGFELLDGMTLNVLAGRSGLVRGGVRLGGADHTPAAYEVRFDSARIAPASDGADGWLIYLDALRFSLTQEGTQLVEIGTEVAIIEGQKAVVGRSTPTGLGDSMVLIVDARVIRGSQS